MRAALATVLGLAIVAAPAAAHTTDAVANCNSVTVRTGLFPTGVTVTQNTYVNQQVVDTAVYMPGAFRADTVTLDLSHGPEALHTILVTLTWTERGALNTRTLGPYTVTCGVPAPPPPAYDPPIVTTPVVPPAPPSAPPPVTPRNPTKPAPNCAQLRKRTSSLRLLDKWGCAPKCPRGTVILRKRNALGKLVWTCYRTPARPINPPAVAG